MANDLSSTLTISTAVATLGDLLSDMSAYTLNVSTDSVDKASTINVPVIDTDDVARDWDATNGYTANSDSAVTSLSVSVAERIKVFKISDSAYNTSPLTLQSYVQQNANEFGRYLQNIVFKEIDANSSVTKTALAESSLTLAKVKDLASALDSAGGSLDRHLIISPSAHTSLLPATAETFGQNVIEQGRFSSLYGLNMHPSTGQTSGTGKTHSFACSKNSIVVVNRLPSIQSTSNLEEYTPFEIEGLGIQCAFRRFYDVTTGIHYGAFTTMFGCGIAVPAQVSAYKRT
jgi:hypothetical protein